jgi:hypothetical protein
LALPEFELNGNLPPGIHLTKLSEIRTRLGVGSVARQHQMNLLQMVADAAQNYSTIKRILLWGSFITTKPEPNDLDYSIVVGVNHRQVQINPEHRRFLVGVDARQFYGVDRNYLVLFDYPLEYYIEKLDFICTTRSNRACGVIKVNLHGEFAGETT